MGKYEPGAELRWFLSGIYFILECHLDSVSSERDRPTVHSQIWEPIQCMKAESDGKDSLHGCYLGVGATNSGDEKIRFSEVKERREYEPRHGCCSVDF